jgi:hypothetical protein
MMRMLFRRWTRRDPAATPAPVSGGPVTPVGAAVAHPAADEPARTLPGRESRHDATSRPRLRPGEFDRTKGGSCIAAIPLNAKTLLCVDLLVDGPAPATVCVRLFNRRPHSLPDPSPLRVSFNPRFLGPLIDALTKAQRILDSAVPITSAAPDPARPSSQESHAP